MSKKLVLIITILLAVFILTGCDVKFMHYDALFDNLGGTLDKLVDKDIEALGALRDSIKSVENKDKINGFINETRTRLDNVKSGNQDEEAMHLSEAVSWLCPLRTVRSRFVSNIASEVAAALNYNYQFKYNDFYGNATDGKLMSKKLVLQKDKALYILEYIEDDDINMYFRVYEDGAYYSKSKADVKCSIDMPDNGVPSCDITITSNIYSAIGRLIGDINNGKEYGCLEHEIYEIYATAVNDLANLKDISWSKSVQEAAVIFDVSHRGYHIVTHDRNGKVENRFREDKSEAEALAKTLRSEKVTIVSGKKTKEVAKYNSVVIYNAYEYAKGAGGKYWVGISVTISSEHALHRMVLGEAYVENEKVDEVKINADKIKPVRFSDSYRNEQLNAMLNGPVKVLKSNFSDYAKLENVCDAIYNIKNGSDNESHIAIMKNAFTYLDKEGNETATTDNAKQLDLFGDKEFLVTDTHTLYLRGTDMAICKIDVTHWNRDEFDNVFETAEDPEGSGSIKYWWASLDDSVALDEVYLMSYPLWYIDKITSSTAPADFSWKVAGADAKMYINLYTRKLTYDAEGRIGTVNAANLNDVYSFDVGNFSFSQLKLSDDGYFVNTRKDAIKTGKGSIDIKRSPIIMINDYLEGTYLPSLAPQNDCNEMYAALGRKMRVQKYYGSDPNDTFAFIVGKNGVVIGSETNNEVAVKIKELTGITQIPTNVSNAAIDKLALNGTSYKETVVMGGDADGNGMIVDSRKMNKLYRHSIDTGIFGKSSLGYADNKRRYVAKIDAVMHGNTDELQNSNIKVPNLFIIGTDYSIVNSRLVSDWINAEDKGNGNMAWWAEWLRVNGYKYTISTKTVEEALTKDHRFDMAKEGYVILDLETIAKIQDIYDDEQIKGEAKFIRTFSYVAGIILIVFSMLLMGAWVIDINVGSGEYKLLGKLTFGRLVAVSGDVDGLDDEDEKVSYMTFGKLFIRIAIVIGFAILLMTFDVVDLFYGLLRAIEAVVNTIKEVIFNIR